MSQHTEVFEDLPPSERQMFDQILRDNGLRPEDFDAQVAPNEAGIIPSRKFRVTLKATGRSLHIDNGDQWADYLRHGIRATAFWPDCRSV